MRDGPADWHGVLGPECTSRVPIAPRGEGRRGGGLLTSENPRHGRSRLDGARDRARTGVGRAGRGAAAGPGRTPEGTRPRGCRCRVGGSRGLSAALGRGGCGGARFGGPSQGENRDRRRPLSPAQAEALSRCRTPGKWGHRVSAGSLSRIALSPGPPTLRVHGRDPR